MNLARAFAELELGAELYCLHRNRWWQTARGPLLDSGCSSPGSSTRRRRGDRARQAERRVLRRARARRSTRAGHDVDGRRRPRDGHRRRARRRHAARSLVRTGKFRPDASRRRACARRDRLVDRTAPGLDSRSTSEPCPTCVGIDLIEIERIRRALARYPGFRERCFTEAERAYCDSRPNPAQSYAGRFAGKEAVGKALGFGVARAFAWREIEIVGRPKPAVRLSGRLAERAERHRSRGGRPLDDALARARAGGRGCVARRAEPLYTAEEMRAAEAGHDVDAMMQRAGAAVAEEVMRRFPDARRVAVYAGGGANGGDGKIAGELLRRGVGARSSTSGRT